MDLKDTILEQLREDHGFVIELQRVLNIDFIETEIDELKEIQEKQTANIKKIQYNFRSPKGHNEALRKLLVEKTK